METLLNREHLSVMSGVTPAGQVVSLMRPYALRGMESVVFLRHLFWYFGSKLLVIWDGASIHRSDEVKDFLAEGWAKYIHLERFPAYAPELKAYPNRWYTV